MFKKILTIIFLSLSPTALLSDEIHTKNGRVYRGEIVARDTKKIRLNLGSGKIRVIRTADIIEHQKEPLEDILLYLGKKEIAGNHIALGAKTLLRAYQANASHPEIKRQLATAQAKLANIELDRKRPLSALQLLRQAQALLPDDKQIADSLERAEAIVKTIDKIEKEALLFSIQKKWFEAYKKFKILLNRDLSRGTKIRKPFAQTLVALGDSELLKNEWILAKNYYNEALEQDPDIIQWIEERWVTSHLRPIRELIERSSSKSALDEIEHVLSVASKNVNALYFRALIFWQLDELEKSKKDFIQILVQEGHKDIPQDFEDLEKEATKYYKTTIELPSLDTIQQKWEQSQAGDWKEITGSGWVLYHHNDWIANQIRLVIDDSIKKITQKLTSSSILPPLSPPIEIYIFRNEEEFSKASQTLGWAAGVTHIKQQGNQILSRKIMSYQTSPQLVTSTIPHELAHALLPLFLKNGTTPTPHWIEEGVACQFEPEFKKKFYKNLIQQHGAAGTQLSLKELLSADAYPKNEEDVKLFYGQSFLLVDYLIKTYGAQTFLNWAKTATPTNSVAQLKSWVGSLDSLEESLFGP